MSLQPFTNDPKFSLEIIHQRVRLLCGHGCVAILSCAARGPKPPDAAAPKSLTTIADHLRKRRLDLGLCQGQMAERLGVDIATVGAWENHRAEPGIRRLPAVIVFLGYNPLPAPRTLAERLVYYRKTHGLSQQKLADLLGTESCTLCRWVRPGAG